MTETRSQTQLQAHDLNHDPGAESIPDRDRSGADSVTTLLRTRGIMPTSQRVQLGRMVLTRPAHFSAEQLYEQVNQTGARVSKATVYNTLGLFVDKGLLRQVLVDPSKVFYDSNVSPHHHFYDVETGELEDIGVHEIEIGALPQITGQFRVEGVDVVVRIRRTTER